MIAFKHGKHTMLISDCDWSLICFNGWQIQDQIGYAMFTGWPYFGQAVHCVIAKLMGISGEVINHIDLNPLNNQRNNLEASTRSYNSLACNRKAKARDMSEVLIDIEDLEISLLYGWYIQNGYAMITKGKYRKKYLNRVIALRMGLLSSLDDKAMVDHENQNKLDNRRGNLRLATRSENSANKEFEVGVSGYIGVYAEKDGTYRARIMWQRSMLHIGTFDCAIEAAIAYDKKAIELRGKFANLNFPRENYAI